MRKRWIGMAIGTALLVALGVPLGAGKAMALSTVNCFGPNFELDHSNDVFTANATEGGAVVGSNADISGLTFIHVNDAGGDEFCQARIASNSSIVVIYDLSRASGTCLAYSSADNDVYLHGSNGCNGTSATYLQWRFIYLTTARGYKIYALQNQYAPSGDPCASFSFGAPPQYNPVYGVPCNTSDPNQSQIYEPF